MLSWTLLTRIVIRTPATNAIYNPSYNPDIIQLGTKRPSGSVHRENKAYIYRPEDGRCVGNHGQTVPPQAPSPEWTHTKTLFTSACCRKMPLPPSVHSCMLPQDAPPDPLQCSHLHAATVRATSCPSPPVFTPACCIVVSCCHAFISSTYEMPCTHTSHHESAHVISHFSTSIYAFPCHFPFVGSARGQVVPSSNSSLIVSTRGSAPRIPRPDGDFAHAPS